MTGAFPEAGGGFGVRGSGRSVFGRGLDIETGQTIGFGDAGSAARFFYAAKADGGDRIGSRHPTVKPVDLMQWLTRLVCPPGGRVLDPFAGTGTTGEAAWREGFSAVLIEREAAYCDDIRRRLGVAGSPSARRAVVATARAARAGGAGEGDLPLFAAGSDGPRTAAGGGR